MEPFSKAAASAKQVIRHGKVTWFLTVFRGTTQSQHMWMLCLSCWPHGPSSLISNFWVLPYKTCTCCRFCNNGFQIYLISGQTFFQTGRIETSSQSNQLIITFKTWLWWLQWESNSEYGHILCKIHFIPKYLPFYPIGKYCWIFKLQNYAERSKSLSYCLHRFN